MFQQRNKKKKNKLKNVIKSWLRDLEEEIKEMSEDEKETEQPNEVVNLVKKILEFNNQNQDGKGLNILTPDQILSRLPITLAQLKAENNPERLKNELRQLLHSLYRSKKLTKQSILI